MDDPHQSRHHVEIHRKDGPFYLVDLGCRWRKYVNGIAIESEDDTEITDGDVITLGDYQLRFLLWDA